MKDEALLSAACSSCRRQPRGRVTGPWRRIAVPDTFVAYMANLMLGSMYDSSGQTEAAAARYAKASSIAPASSARLALAAALVKQGRARDAADISDQTLAGDRLEDPWRMYGLGMFHALPQYLAAMRAELR